MSELIQVKSMVSTILERYPETRNSDKKLIAMTWSHFYPEMVRRNSDGALFILLKDMLNLPSPESIRRVRQKIQNTDKKFPPTDWEVARRRKFLGDEWKEALGYHVTSTP